MASERHELPPGYTGPVRCVSSTGRAAGLVYWAVHCPGGKRTITGDTREMAVERAWGYWLPAGISRKRWEAMERAEAELARVTAERDQMRAVIERVRALAPVLAYEVAVGFEVSFRHAAWVEARILAALDGEGASDGE